MPLGGNLRARVQAKRLAVEAGNASARRVGDAVFVGDYPKTWDGYVGQASVKAQLIATCRSARVRGKRLPHTLLASAQAGVGKTSIARLLAGEMGVGFAEVSGVVAVDEARKILRDLQDGDILFYDEIHQAVQGGKGKAEWLLHLLQDGVLVTALGREPMPDITVVAATTDAQRLPRTILGRFEVRPTLEVPSDDDSQAIALTLSERMGFGGEHLKPLSLDLAMAVARAGDASPREMRAILVALRDHTIGTDADEYDLPTALAWAGYTYDGLTKQACDYLLALVLAEGKAGLSTLAGILGEPGPLDHTEALLQRRGYMEIEANGRRLTEAGQQRAFELVEEMD